MNDRNTYVRRKKKKEKILKKNLYDDSIEAHRAPQHQLHVLCHMCRNTMLAYPYTVRRRSRQPYGILEFVACFEWLRLCAVCECVSVEWRSAVVSVARLDSASLFNGCDVYAAVSTKTTTTTIGYVRVVFHALVYEQLICMYDITSLHACMQSMQTDQATAPSRFAMRSFTHTQFSPKTTTYVFFVFFEIIADSPSKRTKRYDVVRRQWRQPSLSLSRSLQLFHPAWAAHILSSLRLAAGTHLIVSSVIFILRVRVC